MVLNQKSYRKIKTAAEDDQVLKLGAQDVEVGEAFLVESIFLGA